VAIWSNSKSPKDICRNNTLLSTDLHQKIYLLEPLGGVSVKFLLKK
jgi:hypothetical protein